MEWGRVEGRGVAERNGLERRGDSVSCRAGCQCQGRLMMVRMGMSLQAIRSDYLLTEEQRLGGHQ